jgi:hypothetical protein
MTPQQHITLPLSQPPSEARDFLHLSAIQAWQAIASGKPAPAIDPLALQQEICEAFTAGNGLSPVERLVEGWYDLARQCGIAVHDEHGDLRPEVDDAITRTVTAAIWFGITTGYLTLTGTYRIPRKLAGWA